MLARCNVFIHVVYIHCHLHYTYITSAMVYQANKSRGYCMALVLVLNTAHANT